MNEATTATKQQQTQHHHSQEQHNDTTTTAADADAAGGDVWDIVPSGKMQDIKHIIITVLPTLIWILQCCW